jgi:hypothetical protein|tara:strand:+ start:288 stop:431 length:144 start_codon:yes stop_codon:yes gene_type:complete
MKLGNCKKNLVGGSTPGSLLKKLVKDKDKNVKKEARSNLDSRAVTTE